VIVIPRTYKIPSRSWRDRNEVVCEPRTQLVVRKSARRVSRARNKKMNFMKIRMSCLTAAAAASTMLLVGCATQPPDSIVSSRVSGSFPVVNSSGDHFGLKQLDVRIDGASGVLYLRSSDSAGTPIQLQLTHCTVLDNGTVDALSWKSSFLDGQEADVVRCVASGPDFAQHFAVARSVSGALTYHPPMLARMLPGTRDIVSGQGRLIFLWNGGGTAAYAVSKQ